MTSTTSNAHQVNRVHLTLIIHQLEEALHRIHRECGTLLSSNVRDPLKQRLRVGVEQ